MAATSVTRRYRFSAAHRLHSDRFSEEENWRLFGKCHNPNGHGHNYVLFVTVAGEPDRETGMVLDVAALDRVVIDTVVQRFDHRDLNQDPEFSSRTTTGENMVLLVWDLLVKQVPAGRLQKVGLIETRDNYFEYSGTSRL